MRFTVSHILLDIEGTTCPVDFVANTLFPFAREHLGTFIREHAQEPVVAALLEEAEAAWITDRGPGAIASREALGPGKTSANAEELADYLIDLIKADRKLPALKELQGMIWSEGYADGKLLAPLYEEVGPTLAAWREAGIALSVYSSGSVSAQKLLYSHSSAGNLCDLFSGWFDTRIGAKTEAQSYQKIAALLAVGPEETLFISDSLKELAAAHSAGFQVCFSDRDGNPYRNPGPYSRITRLDQIQPVPLLP
jgi:enolase-phosphatase E1